MKISTLLAKSIEHLIPKPMINDCMLLHPKFWQVFEEQKRD
jgi:hypothetical protein